jgi:DNA-binding NtrC family response regulator
MAKFLVVDDDAVTVRAMTRLLRIDGHEVSPFTEGAHAIDAMARDPFDAVLTDLDMPEVDGHAIVRAARRHAPEACVIVSTGRRAGALPLLEAGACVVHDKPVDYEAIISAINACRARRTADGDLVCPRKTSAAPPPVSERLA